MSKHNKKLSLKKIRDDLYRLRDFEISHLWQRSIFLTAFLVLCFTGYGGLLIKILDSDVACKSQILHEIACGIALVGITLSIIYIKMAKGSKAWYEVHEKKLGKIEKKFGIPKKYRGAESEVHPIHTNLFSTKAGAYSPSRLNVVIGIVLFVIWLFVIFLHYGFVVCFLIETSKKTSDFIHLISVVSIPVLFTVILLTAVCNKWAKSESLAGKQ